MKNLVHHSARVCPACKRPNQRMLTVDSRPYLTRHFLPTTYRRKKCVRCDHAVSTIEIPIELYEKLMRGTNHDF